MSHYGVYQKMSVIYSFFGGIIVVDSAFVLGAQDYLIKSSKKDPIGDVKGVAINRATSVYQLLEWNMRTIQTQFPQMKKNINGKNLFFSLFHTF